MQWVGGKPTASIHVSHKTRSRVTSKQAGGEPSPPDQSNSPKLIRKEQKQQTSN